jgi:hypothetical protein
MAVFIFFLSDFAAALARISKAYAAGILFEVNVTARQLL